MSERLYRGKCNEIGKLCGQWIEGFYAEDDGKPLIAQCRENGIVGYFCDPYSIGQDTGKKDKNGRKIYDGDCLKVYIHGFPVYGFVVRFYPEHSAFMARCIETNTVHYLCDFNSRLVEVIGNVHDTPALLDRR